MRVFIGLMEIANSCFTYAKGFRSLGHETYTVVLFRNRYYPASQYDEVLREGMPNHLKGARPWKSILIREVLRLSAFLKALHKCDTFIFLFGTSFLPGACRYWDYHSKVVRAAERCDQAASTHIIL
jgi:hypothetical protein